MIDIDKLKNITHLVTHANCPDGVASALIIKDALPDVKVSFLLPDEGSMAELHAEPGMLFCDLSPPRARVQEFIQAGAIVLDHHPTARDIVEAFGDNGVFGLNEKAESGAWLAYEHVWKSLCELRDELVSENYPKATSSMVEAFAWRAGVRDTWKTTHLDWELAVAEAALRTFWKMAQSVTYYTDESAQRTRLGKRLAENMLEAAQRSLDESFRFSTRYGTNVLMFQGVTPTSDAAELCEKLSFEVHLVVGFHYKVDAGKLQLKFSMRSHTGFDCAAFAKYHGGGGHKAAAGFTIEIADGPGPYLAFKTLLEHWEAR